MDERKEGALLRKLAQMYAVGELNKQGYREQRDAILDFCEGIVTEIPQAEETPVNVIEPVIERLDGEATNLRAASSIVEESHPPKKRGWGLIFIALALAVSSLAIYFVYR